MAHTGESIFDADETDPEDYNIRSAERTELLIQLKGLSEDRPVSPAFWACCQLADMNSLKVLVDIAKLKPNVVLLTQDTLEYVPRLCELLDVLGYIEVVFNYGHAYS